MIIIILGGVHILEGTMLGFFGEWCFILNIDGGGSRQRGAVETRRPMRGDGLAQVEAVVWRHNDVDGRVA